MLKNLKITNPNQTAQILLQKIRVSASGEVVDHLEDGWLLPGQTADLQLGLDEGYVICNRYVTAEEVLPTPDVIMAPVIPGGPIEADQPAPPDILGVPMIPVLDENGDVTWVPAPNQPPSN